MNCSSQLSKLSQIQNQIDLDKNIESAIESVKPKIFWKDKPVFLKQIRKWNSKKLNNAKNILAETEIKMKTRLNSYNSTLIKNLLIRLYQIASSTS